MILEQLIEKSIQNSDEFFAQIEGLDEEVWIYDGKLVSRKESEDIKLFLSDYLEDANIYYPIADNMTGESYLLLKNDGKLYSFDLYAEKFSGKKLYLMYDDIEGMLLSNYHLYKDGIFKGKRVMNKDVDIIQMPFIIGNYIKHFNKLSEWDDLNEFI